MSNVNIQILSLVIVVLFCVGCQPATERSAEKELTVAVSIEPQRFLTDQIGGEWVRTTVIVPVGREPENYQPTPEKIAALSRAKVWFQTGMPFEKTLQPKLESIAPSLAVVDLRDGIKLRTLELHSHDDSHARHDHEAQPSVHVHGPNCAHQPGDSDPHIWLGPTVLKTQAETVLKTLVKLDPTHEEYFRRNYESLIAEIDKTREEIAALLKSHENGTVFVFHPAYGYFCDEFHLKQRAIEFEGKSPTAAQLAELVSETKSEKIPPIIFVQPEFNRAPAEAIAEATGARILVHSPLDRNLLANLKRLAEMIASKSDVDEKQ